MLSKSGGLQRYKLEIAETEVRIVSGSSGSVKFTLALDSLQVKTITPVSNVKSVSSPIDDDVTGSTAAAQ